MSKSCCLYSLALLIVGLNGSLIAQPTWEIGKPVFKPGEPGSFDATAVKDPSIVYYEGRWHLFYTARGNGQYSLGYVSDRNIDGLDTAPRHQLRQLHGRESSYAAAPQVLYFTPHRTWYLIFQTRDSNYQPVYSTTKDIADPGSWSSPAPLTPKTEQAKWIDFWVICDTDTAYLFYTRNHEAVYVRTTSLEGFPEGFGNPRKLFSGVHEAVHIYRVKGLREYHMVYELNNDGIRSYGLAKSKQLAGPWRKITDSYANGKQLNYSGNVTPWTGMISHGEVIRSGHNQELRYDAENPGWIFQGICREQLSKEYTELPWILGLMKQR